jgi:hypothetical protein
MDVLQDIKRDAGACIDRNDHHARTETADHKEATMSFKEKRKPVFGQR